MRLARLAALLAIASALASSGVAVALSYETGLYTAGSSAKAAGLQMNIRNGSFSVKLMRFPEHCEYGSRRIYDYITFRSGTRAKLTGKVSASGSLSGRYAAFDGTDTVSGHVQGGQATVKATEESPYNPASTVQPNYCHGAHTFHATLASG